MKKDKNIPVKQPAHIAKTQQGDLFTKDNYWWMLIGVVIVAIGILLMVGGKSKDPQIFQADVIYSFTRITLAPILIVGGLVIEVYAIMKKPKA